MNYKCDSCNENIDISTTINNCPHCGSRYIRDINEPMKKIARAKCLMECNAEIVIHPDGYREFRDLANGDKDIMQIIKIDYEREIDEIEYSEL